MSYASTALVAAESILALTPIAIKKTPLDPVSAIWSRILSSAVLGYLLTGDGRLPRAEWGTATALGATNLIHIASSYEAFRHLPAGQATSLLYTYPLWNLLFMGTFGGERIAPRNYLFMGIATMGAFLLNMDPGIAAPTALIKTANPSWGIFMGLLMAMSESTMVVLLKLIGWRDPAKSVFVVNAGSSVWLAALLVLKQVVDPTTSASMLSVRNGSPWDVFLLTAFHAVTLFSGYWLRFYAVPRLSTVTYAILSYAGLIASYLFGILFVKETPGWISILGAAIIVLSGLALQLSKDGDESKKEEDR
jgi:drug/metabolite transporter (DMT)-like permease